MTDDRELIERVKTAMIMYNPNDDMVQLAIAAVRAYDAERRSSVLDVDALAAVEFGYQPVTDLDVIEGQKEFAAALADQRSDPDDYRDLPVAMTADVRFKGGLTEGK